MLLLTGTVRNSFRKCGHWRT